MKLKNIRRFRKILKTARWLKRHLRWIRLLNPFHYTTILDRYIIKDRKSVV